jgi:glycerol kinase
MLLAIDQGTSATKALLVARDGAVVARGSAAIGQDHPQPGWVEQSAEEIWDSVLRAVAQCLDGIDVAQVAAVGLSTQRESLVLWERATGTPVGPLLSWQDQRTAPHCARLRAAGQADRVRALSGLPLDPMFSAPKAAWLLDAHDPDRSRSRRGELCLGTVDSWLLTRLGRDHVIEVGNAARTQLLDVRERRWEPELLAPPVPSLRSVGCARCWTARPSGRSWATRTPRSSRTPAGGPGTSRPRTGPARRS